MDTSSARAAFGYLAQRSLIQDIRVMAELPPAFITASGIDAIEDARRYPQEPTKHFPAVVNILHIGTHSGGTIQQGNINSTQIANATTMLQEVDYVQLTKELKKLRLSLLEIAGTTEHYIAIGHIASAETEAKKGDKLKMQEALAALVSSGRWVLDKAEKIGVGLVTALIKDQLVSGNQL